MAIYREVIECRSPEAELLLTPRYGAGAFSVEEQDLPDGRVRLLVYYYDPQPGAEPVDETVDWQSVSEQPWVPVELGERIWLAPPWLDAPTPAGRFRIDYLRGQACGTGFHAATQLCLAAMDRYLKPGDRFFDVGIGSGILSIAARKLGAATIIGCDIDHPSTVIAAANTGEPAFTGSARSMPDDAFDLIAANINATMVTNLADDLERVLKPGGYLIAGGFKTTEQPRVALPIADTLDLDGWRAIVYQRPR